MRESATDELVSEKTLSLADLEQLSQVPSAGNEESKQEFMLLIDKMHRGGSFGPTPMPRKKLKNARSGADSSSRLSKRSYSSVLTVTGAAEGATCNTGARRGLHEYELVTESAPCTAPGTAPGTAIGSPSASSSALRWKKEEIQCAWPSNGEGLAHSQPCVFTPGGTRLVYARSSSASGAHNGATDTQANTTGMSGDKGSGTTTAATTSNSRNGISVITTHTYTSQHQKTCKDSSKPCGCV